jgi:hypothetical protein
MGGSKVWGCGRGQELWEEWLLSRFPPAHAPGVRLATPAVLTDDFGKIVLWYLPGVLSNHRQVATFQLISENTALTFILLDRNLELATLPKHSTTKDTEAQRSSQLEGGSYKFQEFSFNSSRMFGILASMV